ncbi:hypothetical protein LLO_0112 [Legionella longbeachae NSW150]|uniref:Uncharacterized protein n=2 Tax=Legionella longbeachae TaxID=450 RepID=D3HNH5_LEGLN|nr:hypothetical protein LLO_0112 [Legionella longbeachae NSW150]
MTPPVYTFQSRFVFYPEFLETRSIMYQLNRYSTALIFVYLSAVFIMVYGSPINWSEGLTMTLPLITVVIFWSEILTSRLNLKKSVSTLDSFHRDLFIINYATLFAFIASLLIEHNNPDAKGWWPLLIIVAELYGIVLGSVFALLLDRKHFKYTLIFAVVLSITFSTLKLMPPYIHILILGETRIFPLCAFLLISAHVMGCIAWRLSKYNLFKK